MPTMGEEREEKEREIWTLMLFYYTLALLPN
jgi:hypothetical protein